jgi:hypothetical protein
VTYDSIYPEFFRTGLGRLQKQGARNGDFLALFSALERFRRELTDQQEVSAILRVAELYVSGLELFETTGFYLINPTSFAFEPARCAPEDQADSLRAWVRQQMTSGNFAWALRQNTTAFFNSPADPEPVRGVLHTMGVATHRVGMFCGILKKERAPSQELTFHLLSILLGTCADALARVRTTADLHNQVLAANDSLQRTLRENEVLARIPAENPSPVLRLNCEGQVLYSNESGLEILRTLGCQVGDWLFGNWVDMLQECFRTGQRREFEAVFQGRVFAFTIVPIVEAGYANFYGADITARKTAEIEREHLIGELRDALAKVKTLSGLVPICAWCKKIRDDRGFWNEVEVYVQTRSDATFSHGVCPHCRDKLMDQVRAI